MIPRIIETGIFTKRITSTEFPCAIPMNVEKSTIAKTSSRDAPARISCGMLFLVPYPLSISSTIFGITTAGDTAPSTEPIMADSSMDMFNSIGANTIKAPISKIAGKNDIKKAGLPTFLRSEMFSDKPAFIKIMIKAICLSSVDMLRMLESRKFRTYGPRTIPVTSIPIIRGSFSFWHIRAIDKPTRKMSESDVSIKTSFGVKKADNSVCSNRSHQLR
jgi:hypothetical protein